MAGEKNMNEEMHEAREGAPEYAGFWIRAGAAVIDMLLMTVVFYLLYGDAYFEAYDYLGGSGAQREWMEFVLPAVATVLFWVYFQATPGKMAVGVKLIDANGRGKPTVGQCIGRYFAYIPSLLFFGLGFLWVVFDKRKQGWHDKLAGTLVIKKARG